MNKQTIQWIAAVTGTVAFLVIGGIFLGPRVSKADTEGSFLFPYLYQWKQQHECRLEVSKKTAECQKKESAAERNKCLWEVRKKAASCGV